MSDKIKPKFISWYETDFQAEPRVRHMKPTARHFYRALLIQAFYCSTRPYLPDDDAELWMLADAESEQQWMEHAPVVRRMFTPVVIDSVKLLSQKRLIAEWETMVAMLSGKGYSKKTPGVTPVGGGAVSAQTPVPRPPTTDPTLPSPDLTEDFLTVQDRSRPNQNPTLNPIVPGVSTDAAAGSGSVAPPSVKEENPKISGANGAGVHGALPERTGQGGASEQTLENPGCFGLNKKKCGRARRSLNSDYCQACWDEKQAAKRAKAEDNMNEPQGYMPDETRDTVVESHPSPLVEQKLSWKAKQLDTSKAYEMVTKFWDIVAEKPQGDYCGKQTENDVNMMAAALSEHMPDKVGKALTHFRRTNYWGCKEEGKLDGVAGFVKVIELLCKQSDSYVKSVKENKMQEGKL